MKKLLYALFPLLIAGCNHEETKSPYTMSPSHTLWYETPAKIWEETLPLGDGRLGMMPDGGIYKEKIVLNDITMWSGSEFDYSNPEASKYLPEIRKLLAEGKNIEAQKVMYEHFVPKKSETGGTYGAYQMLCDLNIDYYYSSPDSIVENYIRGLDLTTGTAWTDFKLNNGVSYKREYFVPREEEGMLIKLSASRPGEINFTYTLSRPERGHISSPKFGEIILTGELDSGQEDVSGVKYCVGSGVKAKGKKVNIQMEGDSAIKVQQADEVWIGISAATSFLYNDKYEDMEEKFLNKILENPAEAIKRGNEKFQSLMSRSVLILPANENSWLPTDKRLLAFQEDDNDLALASLYYNYGRYLLISSTRPDLLPPNLQGLWANGPGTPWNGDYHTNINVQMNHWPAETGNLSELHLPLAELTRKAVPSGERSAKVFYGPDANGWVMHMMTNVWNYTEPGENPSWGATNTGGAWLCEHLWDHYEYSGDQEFLRKYYPVMKGAAMFFLSTMINEPKNGWLVTAPSSSPENEFYVNGNESTPVSICMGPAMDTQIVSELWNNVIKASEVLDMNDPDIPNLKEALKKLPPMQIDSTGRLMEWLEEYKEVDPKHRHVSHLYGLYPGISISPEKTPELLDAARKTLEVRGNEGTGWSRAWKINFYARLLDGDMAWNTFRGLLQPAIIEDSHWHRAGTFPNLFCSHPPFQIDGNFGASAGIGEMLIQSHEGYINLLPAIPANFTEGELKGYKTRGGNEIDLKWKNGFPREAQIKAGYKELVRLKVPNGINNIKTGKGENITIPDSRIVEFNLPVNKVLNLEFE